jgi:hypothetical protein
MIKTSSKTKRKTKNNNNNTKNKTTITKSTQKKTKKESVKYVIAIPSYNRSIMLQEKTLSMLKKHNIGSQKIYIFVANDKQSHEYKHVIPKGMYHKIVVGELGLMNQRNFITKYFPNNTNIVQMDDDITDIKQLDFAKSKLSKKTKKPHKYYQTKSIEHLNQFIKHSFIQCRSKNLYLWGVFPVNNPYFMNTNSTTDLRFIVGPFFGIINRKHKDRKELLSTIDEKEDVERSIKYYIKDGGVMRFNYISIETKYYRNPGGMQSEMKNRKEEALNSATYLHDTYPQYTTLYLKKKSGYSEVKLKDKTK